MSSGSIPAWDGQDIAELFMLDATGVQQFRTRCGDANAHGRAYGGQILGQAILAAARTVPDGRSMTTLQFMFLQGTLHDAPLDLSVTSLQDGKRFSIRHVRGAQQGERFVLDAQVSFAVPIAGAPAHGVLPRVELGNPEVLPTLAQLPSAWGERVHRAVGYRLETKDVLDFRFDAPPDGLRLDLPEPSLRFWVRLKERLPGGDSNLHAAAFAYLSDWWLNYAAVGAHQDAALEIGGLYVASLNHAIWLHGPLRADQWLHFDCVSPAAASGRGLSMARVHDREGRLVASCTQECLMVPRTP